jgi:WD40 repeat protein
MVAYLHCSCLSSTLASLKSLCHVLSVRLQARVELYDRRQTKWVYLTEGETEVNLACTNHPNNPNRRFINAHNNALCCLALSLEGKRLASASDKGTLVRVWNTADGQLLQVWGWADCTS